MTLIEAVVVITVVGFFLMLLISSRTFVRAHPMPINCVNNLKQCALATRVWEGDNNDKYPPQVSVTNGGSMELTTGPNAWRTFQVMSNELCTPKVVICPIEEGHSRFFATNFITFCNSNVSFFVGVDANETDPASILYGDHNITNGMPIRNGILMLTTNRPSGWTSDIHNKVGNLAFADGSVRQVTIDDLQTVVANSGMESNRLQMPVLGP